MKGIVNFLQGKQDETTFMFSSGIKDFDYCFDVDVADGCSVEEIFGGRYKTEALESVKEWINACKIDDMLSEDDKKLMKELARFKGIETALFDDCEYVSFEMTLEEIAHFLKDNPSLQNKKVVLNGAVQDTSLEDINHIREVFGDNVNLLRFDLFENDNLVTLEEYERTVLEVEKRVNKIKSYGFSPVELAMYAYDLVRDREYREETRDEDVHLPRNLSSVLFGEYVVCTGFARMLVILLKKLGIKARVYTIKRADGENHDQVVAFLDDEKYDVKGIYYFDPTIDSKKNGSRDFLYSFRTFALTKEQCVALLGDKFSGVIFEKFDESMVDRFIGMCKSGRGDEHYIENVRLINSILTFVKGGPLKENMFGNVISTIFGQPMDEKDVERFSNELDELLDMIDSPIPAEVFIKALYNVRKVQYYERPREYPFGIKDFYMTYKVSGWTFEDVALDNLLKAIFKEKIAIEEKSQQYKFVEFLDENDLRRKIEGIRLTRTLKEIAVQEEEKRIKLK